MHLVKKIDIFGSMRYIMRHLPLVCALATDHLSVTVVMVSCNIDMWGRSDITC